MTLVLPIVMALSFLPDLKTLAPVTLVGTFLLLLGLSLLAVVIAQEWPNRPHEQIHVQWSQVPLALCAILYSFEGICLVLPVKNSMLRKSHFRPVFVAAMVTSAFIYAVVSSLSVAVFGKVTNGSITAFLLDNVHEHKGLIQASNAAVSLSVLVTYPLQLYPCLELLQPLLAETHQDFQTLPEDPTEEYENVRDTQSTRGSSRCVSLPSKLRIGLVLMTYVIAVFVPNVQTLIALSGALAGSSTALVLPPVLELAWLRTVTEPVRWWKHCRAWMLLTGGIVFLLIGTVSSVVNMVQLYLNR